MKALRDEITKALGKPRPVDDASRLAAPECAPITEFLHFSGGAGATLQKHSIERPPPVATIATRRLSSGKLWIALRRDLPSL